jgi:hypothetical protein
MPASKAPNRYPQNHPLNAESYRIALPPIDSYHENPFTDALLKHLSLARCVFLTGDLVHGVGGYTKCATI